MNEKKSILKFELYDDGTSTNAQDLLGLLAYVQKVAAEGGKTVDLIADVVCKVAASVQKKSAETQKEIDSINLEARNRRDKPMVSQLEARVEDLQVELREAKRSLASESQDLDIARNEIQELEHKLKLKD